MLLALAGVYMALRVGLSMRRQRQRGAGKAPGQLARHMTWGRPAILLAGLGLLSGPLSAVFLRNWEPLRTLHGGLALVAGALLLVAGFVGWKLSRGESRAVEAHGRLAVLAALLAGLAAFAGFVLLP